MDWKPLIAAEKPEEDEPIELCNPPFVWIKVVFDGGMDDDPALLESWPEHCGWLDYEMECRGLQALIGDDDGTFWWEWMLHNGIAPGQEFWVKVQRVSYTTDYWGEHGVDYGDWEITAREPMPEDRAGRLWFAWVKDLDNRKIEIMKP